MATKLSIDKLQKQAEKFEQAAQEARPKAAEVVECKERKRMLKKKPRNKRRRMKNHTRCVEKCQKMTKTSQDQGQPMKHFIQFTNR